MKGQKLLSLDVDIIKQLQGTDNASKLINGLLKDYFFMGDSKKIEQIEADLAKITEEIKQKKNQKRSIIAKKEQSLMNRHADLYKKQYPNLKWDDLLKAYQYKRQ